MIPFEKHDNSQILCASYYSMERRDRDALSLTTNTSQNTSELPIDSNDLEKRTCDRYCAANRIDAWIASNLDIETIRNFNGAHMHHSIDRILRLIHIEIDSCSRYDKIVA